MCINNKKISETNCSAEELSEGETYEAEQSFHENGYYIYKDRKRIGIGDAYHKLRFVELSEIDENQFNYEIKIQETVNI